tara:strand:- start:403 stop:873 length:471 start_codon:yes stop_codon:yes gene_type:complete
MYRVLNYFNRKWNKSVFLFHDIATKINVRWLVTFSIWAHDKMIWELPERMQLIGGIPVTEHRLMRELELANHQLNYFMEYAHDLQDELFLIQEEEDVSDYSDKKKYKKKKSKENARKAKQARRSKAVKNENREKKAIELIQWKNRSRIRPVRNENG